jgi:hypothetical protein
MQFFLIDLAVALLALLGYRALSLASQYRAAVVSLEDRVTPHRRTGGRHDKIAPPAKPALAKPAPREAVTGKRAPRNEQCRSTPHRLINFW